MTSFGDPTAHGLLELLRPEALLKGTDRTPETVPERELVEGYGGELLFLGDPKEHASSALAARLGNEPGWFDPAPCGSKTMVFSTTHSTGSPSRVPAW